MPAAQHVLEETEEQLDRKSVMIEQSDDLCRHVQQVRGDSQDAIAGASARVALAVGSLVVRRHANQD